MHFVGLERCPLKHKYVRMRHMLNQRMTQLLHAPDKWVQAGEQHQQREQGQPHI